MPATRKNVRELVRALKHMMAQSIPARHCDQTVLLYEQDVKDVRRALTDIEEGETK